MTAPKKDLRFRNATFLVYADSAPENWIDLLRAEHVPFVVSPYHDRDMDESADSETGELVRVPKKAHWHVAVCCDGNKPFSYFQQLSDLCSGKLVKKIENLRSMLRYFCHLDNPEKFQYPWHEMMEFGGVKIEDMMEFHGKELDHAINRIEELIEEQHIRTYKELCYFLRVNGYDDLKHVVTCQCTFHFSTLLRVNYYHSKGE